MAQTNDQEDSRVTYDESTGLYRVNRDSSELLSVNVALSTATIEGVRLTQLPPLTRTVDLDVLETVFGCSEDVILSFPYAGCRVTLDAFGSIEVVPIGDFQPPQ